MIGKMCNLSCLSCVYRQPVTFLPATCFLSCPSSVPSLSCLWLLPSLIIIPLYHPSSLTIPLYFPPTYHPSVLPPHSLSLFHSCYPTHPSLLLPYLLPYLPASPLTSPTLSLMLPHSSFPLSPSSNTSPSSCSLMPPLSCVLAFAVNNLVTKN